MFFDQCIAERFCLSAMFFGAFVMAFSLMNITIILGNTYNIEMVNIMFNVSFFSILFDIIVNGFVVFKYNLPKIREEIQNQWETQKVITQENDHEVNLYNAIKRLTKKYPTQIIIISIMLILFGLVF